MDDHTKKHFEECWNAAQDSASWGASGESFDDWFETYFAKAIARHERKAARKIKTEVTP